MSVPIDCFKGLMSCWSTGVCIISSIEDNGDLIGMTMNSFTSVSLHPPKILCCLQRTARTTQAIESNKKFVISILNANQLNLAKKFSSNEKEKFLGVEYTVAKQTGCPIVVGSCAWAECLVNYDCDGGDHIIFIAEVITLSTNEDKKIASSPLLYHSRSYKEF